MAKRKQSQFDDFDDLDDLEFAYGSDHDIELFDDTTIDDIAAGDSSLAAWQRIERRQESEWLRSQVVDWDDWDEYFDSH